MSENLIKPYYELTFLSYSQSDLGCFLSSFLIPGLSSEITNKVIGMLTGYGKNQPTQLSKNAGFHLDLATKITAKYYNFFRI